MIEKVPNIGDIERNRALMLLERDDVKRLVNELNDEYLYWSELKYKRRPKDVSAKELWVCVKIARKLQPIQLTQLGGLSLTITNRMQRLCHNFDMNFGGEWGSSSIVPQENKERYLISSLMEEAISSSQMEGAATTRKVAKDMLRKKVSPKGRSEQMIYNNYKSIQFIVEHKNEPLTEELLLKVHALMTYKTLEDERNEGRLRTDDEVVVENSVTHEVVHTPPACKDIPRYMETLCAFFNDEEQGGDFIHPIIRAIIIHFMVAYVHPFVDGNGRTSRALFYWYMLKQGYWLTEYLSISKVIYDSKASYEKSFLYTEADGMDISYFVNYNMNVLVKAFKNLQVYIESKTAQQRQADYYLKLGDINERQASILSMIEKNPHITFTIKELQSRFAISHPTAKMDVDVLVERGFLEKIPVNKVKFNYAKGKKFDELVKTPMAR